MIIFCGDSSYVEEMNKVHGLPVWTTDARIDASRGIAANEKAFDGELKLCNVAVDKFR